jgi:hypothetical protein
MLFTPKAHGENLVFTEFSARPPPAAIAIDVGLGNLSQLTATAAKGCPP